ncbi:hypothetical protein ACE3MS_00570 [Paenibacillus dendritiformis]|uniref:hypothetical protein n=1 Tax=Paenibacillus dendritiformis TaxID=130049 RepID=UPI003648F4CB
MKKIVKVCLMFTLCFALLAISVSATSLVSWDRSFDKDESSNSAAFSVSRGVVDLVIEKQYYENTRLVPIVRYDLYKKGSFPWSSDKYIIGYTSNETINTPKRIDDIFTRLDSGTYYFKITNKNPSSFLVKVKGKVE